MTNFRLFQTERVCRQQYQIWWKWQKVIQTGRKHYGKRINCSLRAIYPFPAMFSKYLYCRHVKSRVCLGKGEASCVAFWARPGIQVCNIQEWTPRGYWYESLSSFFLGIDITGVITLWPQLLIIASTMVKWESSLAYCFTVVHLSVCLSAQT